MRNLMMIGHSNRSIVEFISLLRRHHVQVLIDVRNYPQSKYNPQFNRDNLDISLREAGIEYRWFSNLGGRSPKPCFQISKTLESILRDQRVLCLMCSEGDHTQCHRHYLLTPIARRLGCNVQQITNTSLLDDSGPTQRELERFAEHLPPDAEEFLGWAQQTSLF